MNNQSPACNSSTGAVALQVDSANKGLELTIGETVSEAGYSIVINAAAWYQQSDFLEWLEMGKGLMAWHDPGEPVGEFTDIVVFVDGSLNGEGAQDGMPEHYWQILVEHCKGHFVPGLARSHIAVIIKNQ